MFGPLFYPVTLSLVALSALFPFLTWFIARVALGPVPTEPWYEKARWLYSARLANRVAGILFVIMSFASAGLFAGQAHSGVEAGALLILVFLAVRYAAYPAYYLLWRRIAAPDERSLRTWISRFALWEPPALMGVTLAAVQQPLYVWLNDRWWLALLCSLVLVIFCAANGAFFTVGWRLARALSDAPDDLQERFREELAAQNLKRGRLWLLHSPVPFACAIPARGIVVYSAGLASLLSREQLLSVLSHEVAHLTESRGMRALRFIPICTLFAMFAAITLLFQYGPTNPFLQLALLAALVLGVLRSNAYVTQRVSVALEERADSKAHARQENDGVYATALALMYEKLLLPSVIGGQNRTHPELYDRMVTAGVTPSYPRPRPPSRTPLRWTAAILAVLLVWSVSEFVVPEIRHGTVRAPSGNGASAQCRTPSAVDDETADEDDEVLPDDPASESSPGR